MEEIAGDVREWLEELGDDNDWNEHDFDGDGYTDCYCCYDEEFGPFCCDDYYKTGDGWISDHVVAFVFIVLGSVAALVLALVALCCCCPCWARSRRDRRARREAEAAAAASSSAMAATVTVDGQYQQPQSPAVLAVPVVTTQNHYSKSLSCLDHIQSMID